MTCSKFHKTISTQISLSHTLTRSHSVGVSYAVSQSSRQCYSLTEIGAVLSQCRSLTNSISNTSCVTLSHTKAYTYSVIDNIKTHIQCHRTLRTCERLCPGNYIFEKNNLLRATMEGVIKFCLSHHMWPALVNVLLSAIFTAIMTLGSYLQMFILLNKCTVAHRAFRK